MGNLVSSDQPLFWLQNAMPCRVPLDLVKLIDEFAPSHTTTDQWVDARRNPRRALETACRDGHIDIARWASANCKTRVNLNVALAIALYNGHADIARLLEENSAVTPINRDSFLRTKAKNAIVDGRVLTSETVTTTMGDPNLIYSRFYETKSTTTNTNCAIERALMGAAFRGELALVQLLVGAGASELTRALLHSIRCYLGVSGGWNIAKWLIDAGANTDVLHSKLHSKNLFARVVFSYRRTIRPGATDEQAFRDLQADFKHNPDDFYWSYIVRNLFNDPHETNRADKTITTTNESSSGIYPNVFSLPYNSNVAVGHSVL